MFNINIQTNAVNGNGATEKSAQVNELLNALSEFVTQRERLRQIQRQDRQQRKLRRQAEDRLCALVQTVN